MRESRRSIWGHLAGNQPGGQHRVVVIGGGFAGLQAVRGLRKADVEVTLVDRRNFHLFQPLLYQVASGAAHSYFGHDEWAPHAPGLKAMEDALEIRRRILTAFETAELESCPRRRRAWLTFAVVGAGPTGLELAGQIAEITRDTLRREFRAIDPGEVTILLIEAAGRVLTAYDPRLSDKAAVALRRLGVTAMLNTVVTGVNDRSIRLAARDGGVSEVQARTIIWAAGVSASPLAGALASASGAELDQAGRVTVAPDLTLPGFPEVFAAGDMVRVADGTGATFPIAGVAPAAIQEGRHAARAIRLRLAGRAVPPFAYRDKGSLATIGRKAAVAQIHRARLSGLVAWMAWLLIHLLFLMGLQNRFIVFIRWTVSFVTHGRGVRLITAAGRPARVRSGPMPPVRASGRNLGGGHIRPAVVTRG
jgi:NADH dehydrogenase